MERKGGVSCRSRGKSRSRRICFRPTRCKRGCTSSSHRVAIGVGMELEWGEVWTGLVRGGTGAMVKEIQSCRKALVIDSHCQL